MQPRHISLDAIVEATELSLLDAIIEESEKPRNPPVTLCHVLEKIVHHQSLAWTLEEELEARSMNRWLLPSAASKYTANTFAATLQQPKRDGGVCICGDPSCKIGPFVTIQE